MEGEGEPGAAAIREADSREPKSKDGRKRAPRSA